MGKGNEMDTSKFARLGVFLGLILMLGAAAVPSQAALTPYSTDANTVLLDHFDNVTGAGIFAYSETGAACGSPKTSATPVSAYVAGPAGLGQALSISAPPGQPAGSVTFLQYQGGQLLSQPNGTLEMWVYLTAYGNGLPLVDQGPYFGSCAGWTYSLSVSSTGQLRSAAWAAFDVNSGTATVPLNAWTHVAASWGSSGAMLYINGVLVGTSTNTGMPASGYGGSVLIRSNVNGGATLIDELRISSVQRTTFAVSGAAGTGAHSASGTYAWNASTGTLSINVASTDFTCNGPALGSQTVDTGIAVTATTMNWPKNGMTWVRTGGTAGDITGTWTSSDPATGNGFTLVANAGGSFTLSGTILSCGGGGGGSSNPQAHSQHWPNGYYVQLQYADPTKAASAVSVTGPGITGSASLTYDTSTGSWNSWTSPSTSVSFGTTTPAGLPYTYTFSITDPAGTTTATSQVACFQDAFVTALMPSGTVSGIPTFSWTGISDPAAMYGVELNDSVNTRIWSSYGIAGNSILYNGPALVSGMTYNYNVLIESSTACGYGQSFAQGSFSYGVPSSLSIPAGLSAVLSGANAVNVSWSPSSGQVAYYQVYRDGAPVGMPSGTTSWPDTAVVAGSTYSYTVAACDATHVCSAPSSPVAVTVPGAGTLNEMFWAGHDIDLGTGFNLYGIALSIPSSSGVSGFTLSGPGIATPVAATLQGTQWYAEAPFGTAAPTLPAIYTATIGLVGGGSQTNTYAVQKWSSAFPTAVNPVANAVISGTMPPITWTNAAGASLIYQAKIFSVSGSSYALIWEGAGNYTASPIVYTGSTLPAGNYSLFLSSNEYSGGIDYAAQVRVPIQCGSAGCASAGGGQSSTINLIPGWNLVGNGLGSPIPVSVAFGNAANVTTVWKWETSGSAAGVTYPAWAFYTPTLADGGAAYAASKGYDFLVTINPGEGFWVNAKANFTSPISGSAVTTASFQDQIVPPNRLPQGWSLIAVGDNPSASGFNIGIGATPPATGVIPGNLVSLWAWDAATANWYFYAPSLDANGNLASYIAGKNYLNFGSRPLDPATGFWVNHP